MIEIMNIQFPKAKKLFLTKINIIFIILLPISIIAGSSIFNSLVILIDLIFIIELIKRKNNYLLKDYNFYFLMIIFLYLILNSLFVATDKEYAIKDYESITRSAGFLRFIILAYAIHFYFINNQNIILKYWLIFFIVVTVDILIEYFFGRNTLGFTSVGGRIASFRPNDLNIGGYYFGFIMISLLFIQKKNTKLFLLASIIFFTTILITSERSNFIKVLSMYIMFILFISQINIYKKTILVLGILLITTVFVMNNEKLKRKFYDHIFIPINKSIKSEDNSKINAAIKRIEYLSLYNSAWKIFKTYPILGSGLKTYRYESYGLKKKDITIYGASTHPHQIHFEILSEIGLIGYILIMLNFINRIYVNRSSKKNFLSKSSILFLIATLIPILPSGSFFSSYTAVIFWINYAFLITAKPHLKS